MIEEGAWELLFLQTSNKQKPFLLMGPTGNYPRLRAGPQASCGLGEEEGQASPPSPLSRSLWSHLQLHPHTIHSHHLVLKEKRAEGEVGWGERGRLGSCALLISYQGENTLSRARRGVVSPRDVSSQITPDTLTMEPSVLDIHLFFSQYARARGA